MSKKLAKKPAKPTALRAIDRDEPISGMEPLLIADSSPRRARLNELAFQLTTVATAFKTSLVHHEFSQDEVWCSARNLGRMAIEQRFKIGCQCRFLNHG